MIFTNTNPIIIGIDHGYRSYSKAIVVAVNEFSERQARLADDPYLETREKEDAFLKRITETIENGLQFAQPAVSTEAGNTDTEELSAALDFADSF